MSADRMGMDRMGIDRRTVPNKHLSSAPSYHLAGRARKARVYLVDTGSNPSHSIGCV